MENELNRLIAEHNNDFDKNAGSDDDAQSNLDIDEFEQRLKRNRSMMGFDSDSDEDDFSGKKKQTSKKPVSANKISGYQGSKPASKTLLSEEPDLLKQVQQMQNQKKGQASGTSALGAKMSNLGSEINKYKKEAQPKSEEEKLMDIFNSNNTNLKDKKLKELIQKNKEMYVTMEKEKNLRQKLQKDLDKMKEETEMQIAAMEGRVVKAPKGQPEEDWRKKYIDLEKKLQETRVQNTTLKNDLNKAMRVISKEVGDNVNIDQILTESGWKGRQQQIEVLKARVKDLQGKLGVSMSSNVSDISYMTDKQSDMSGLLNADDSRSNRTAGFSAAGGAAVGGKAKERREEIESLKLQCEALKAENDALNDKVKALSSRKAILEKDLKDMKNEVERNKNILMEKSGNDDKYIMALKKEVEKLRSAGGGSGTQTRIVYRDKPVEKQRSEVEELEDNLARKELLVLKNELDKREKIIKELISEKVRNVTAANNSLNKENVINEGIPDQEKIVKLETMIKILKQENEDLSSLKLGIKTTTPDSKIIKDLSLQNAQLRRKLDDLQAKIKGN